MQSEIKTLTYANGEIQRVQIVRWAGWGQLDFLRPEPQDNGLEGFERIYRKFLVPACPWIFGTMVMFQLPEELEDLALAGEKYHCKYGKWEDPLVAATALLKHGMRFVAGKPMFSDPQAKKLYQALQEKQSLCVVKGKLPTTSVIPVGFYAGCLSQVDPGAAMKVNGSFFIMDPFDCATVYDQIGVTFGLCVRDGVVEQPPLYDREALIVRRDGSVGIEVPHLEQLQIEINEVCYEAGKNAVIYTRPQYKQTPSDQRVKVVIIGDRVAAVKNGGSVTVPASGFVLAIQDRDDSLSEVEICPGDWVNYNGMEDVAFAVQVGNSVLRDGVKTEQFLSPFYNIRNLEKVPFPPSLYPMDYAGGRAARIALGADEKGAPMLIWAEGAPKVGYEPGKDSCGASLSELVQICKDAGMYNGINLDGGGSAQVLLSDHRFLRISDRKEDGTEAERPVPLGLIVRI